MNDQSKSLLAISCSQILTGDQREMVGKAVKSLAEKLGLEALVVDGGMQVGIHSDIRPLIEDQIAEQRKTNALLLTLIEALGEEEPEDPDAEPMTYMDGTPVAPPTTERRPGR